MFDAVKKIAIDGDDDIDGDVDDVGVSGGSGGGGEGGSGDDGTDVDDNDDDCHWLLAVVLHVVVEDLAVMFRHCILDAIREAASKSVSKSLQLPLDVLSVPSKVFAEQLTFMDAVSHLFQI